MSLKEQLGAMGIALPFDAKRADFSGIDAGKDRLYIGDVVHKAVVKVFENGFEAAAATAVMMAAGAAAPVPTEPLEVVVDRPFFFAIIHAETRAPLFVGRVADPG